MPDTATTSLARANGALIGQQPYALVLDLLAEQHRLGRLDRSDDHPAFDLEPREFADARSALVADGLASMHKLGTPHALTAAGLAAHAEARQALDDIADRIAPLVPLTSALSARRALFGAHAG